MMKTIYALFLMMLVCSQVGAQSLYFPPTTGNHWDTISPQSLNWSQSRIDSLYDYLETNNSKAFILLKDGKIVLEKYFGKHTQNSLWQWASAGKVITSFMVGIAQQENHLSINQPTSRYLGKGWTNCTLAQEDKITIRHQLTMTSGLDDGVPSHYCTLDTCLLYKADAGTRWAYHNGPYTLLDKVIEHATGMTLNAYTNQKLKTPTGITGAFLPVDYNNVFFSNARSMARFGLLCLNKGNWNGNQIMTDSAYFSQMVNTSQTLNKAYGYLWWLNGKESYMVPGVQFVINGFLSPNAPADMYTAMGKDGQFLNVVPSKNMVWIRMGEAPDNLPIQFLMNDKIWAFVNKLDSNTSNTYSPEIKDNKVYLFIKSGSGLLNVKSAMQISSIAIYNTQGQLMKSKNVQGNEIDIPISDLPAGLFLVTVKLLDGYLWKGKVIK